MSSAPKVYEFADSWEAGGAAAGDAPPGGHGKRLGRHRLSGPLRPERPEHLLVPGLGLACRPPGQEWTTEKALPPDPAGCSGDGGKARSAAL